MASGEQKGNSKRKRHDERRRLARRRVLMRRARWGGAVVLLLAASGLWAFENSGPQERVDAEVTETRRWQHFPQVGKPHPHVAATLEIEGLSETTLDRTDGYERGQRVEVWIRRGRISGWPYFLDVVKPGELAVETAAQN